MADRDTSPRSPRRRRLLFGLGALVALGGALSVPVLRRDDTAMIGDMLRARLPDLRIEPDELAGFASEFIDYYRARNNFARGVFLWGVRTRWSFLPDATGTPRIPRFAVPYERLEQELLMAFLMGTDYLESRQDPEASVSYYYMPDPYETGCPNVFARFD